MIIALLKYLKKIKSLGFVFIGLGTILLISIVLAFFYYVAHFRKENSILLISMIHCMNNLIAFSTFYLP